MSWESTGGPGVPGLAEMDEHRRDEGESSPALAGDVSGRLLREYIRIITSKGTGGSLQTLGTVMPRAG